MSTAADRPVTPSVPTPVDAKVYTAHEYSPQQDHASHDGLSDHLVPCVCGSAETAFIHSDEARKGSATVMALAAGDGGVQSESQALAAGGNGNALILPGTDTRAGTPLETQEPNTVRGAVDEAVAPPEAAQPQTRADDTYDA